MRVLYFVTIRNHGRGGHVHSLSHISKAIGEKIEVGVVSIGLKHSPILEISPYFIGHIFFNGINYRKFKRDIKLVVNNYKPDIFHCFDVSAYEILTVYFNINKHTFLVTKCGGPNPPSFPAVENLILFSKENEKWFKSKAKFKNSLIKVIPNRVYKSSIINDDDTVITKENSFCFVRIARIGVAYKKSIEDSIRLIKVITCSHKRSIHLYIIGVIEDSVVYQDLVNKSQSLPISFLTQERFTNRASKLLYLADAVIATGRGIMEATALGKVILTPAKNSALPVLVNKGNFERFLETNFSERNIADDEDLNNNLNNIIELIEKKESQLVYQKQSSRFFKEYFDVEGGISEYINTYHEIKDKQYDKTWAFKNNILFSLRTFISFAIQWKKMKSTS